jgi:hypothetical protein
LCRRGGRVTIFIERTWALASHRTFQIPPIRKLIQGEKIPGIIIDPFPYQSQEDVFDYLNLFDDNSASFGLIDPPYSKRQVSDHYKEQGIAINGWHTSSGWTAKVKQEVGRVMKIGGKTITFGWNSSGIGKINGFEIERILIVCHGGDHYDTICTVETKMGNRSSNVHNSKGEHIR